MVRAFPVQSQTIAVIVLVRDETRLRRLERCAATCHQRLHELRTPITAIRLLVETLQKARSGSPRSPPASSTASRWRSDTWRRWSRAAGAEHHRVGAPDMKMEPVPVVELIRTVDRLLHSPRAVDRGRGRCGPTTPPLLVTRAARSGAAQPGSQRHQVHPPEGRITVSAGLFSSRAASSWCARHRIGIVPRTSADL